MMKKKSRLKAQIKRIIHETNTTPPSVEGEESISGTMPSPESDDDVLQNAKNVGEQLDEDEEHPKEIDIAGDINKAEEYKRTH